MEKDPTNSRNVEARKLSIQTDEEAVETEKISRQICRRLGASNRMRNCSRADRKKWKSVRVAENLTDPPYQWTLNPDHGM